jgi:hypothetical protein
MGDRHEEYLLDMLGGTGSPGSGNQWNRPMDGRHSRYETEFAFAWDGKSTMASSQTVTLGMWDKAQEQARGERPMLALRYYPSDRPTKENLGGVDLGVISVPDLSALLADARGRGALVAALEGLLDLVGEDSGWEGNRWRRAIQEILKDHDG